MCSSMYVWLLALSGVAAGVVEFEQAGGVAGSAAAGRNNTQTLNRVLAALKPGDTLHIPNRTFWVAGGVRAVGLVRVTIVLDGTLSFLPGRSGWPTTHSCGQNPLQPTQGKKSCVQEAILLANSTGLVLSSGGAGTLNGNGPSWWGYVNYLIHGENRPRLLSIINTTEILVERWRFVQSAYWTFTALDVADLEIRQCAVDNRVNGADAHTVANLGAFNTDGFDVSGKNIWIHHSTVWNQDDCFTIQPLDRTGINAQCTENVLIEDVNASGLGLTVGAVRPTRGHNCVRNVTFRRAYMHHTFKGIYVKSQNTADPNATGEISNILYEDVTMDAPSQVPIWIGPAQEADSYHACSLAWPQVPLSSCPPPPKSMLFRNITLRNIRVNSPKQSPGIIYGNPDSPMQAVRFENVVVSAPGSKPWGSKYYYCKGIEGVASGSTSPIPPCFTKA